MLTIGQLRANLGLGRAPLWLESNCADFNSTPATSGSPLESLRASASSEPTATAPLRSPSWLSRALTWGVIVAIPVAAVYFTPRKEERSDYGFTSPQVTTAPAETEVELGPSVPEFSEPSRPYPADGILEHASPGIRRGAPFEVVTAAGAAYFIKVVSADTGAVAFTAFLRGGSRLDTLLPVGRYELRYASGQTWYGLDYLFGPETSYSKAEETFELRRTSDGYEGVTIELILQQFGNLATSPIDEASFNR